MTRASPSIRVGLLWHSMTSGNLGVGALTLANIAIIEEAARRIGATPQFVVLGWTDPRRPYTERNDLEIVNLRTKDFVKPVGGLLGAVRHCDVVLDIGAGDSFTDIYGTRRIGTQIASKLLVLMARRPLILSPQTIGPFNNGLWRRAALATMRRARTVATRDEPSTRFLRDLGYRGPIVEATDVALRLPYTAPAPHRGGPIKVGLNVSALLFNGGYTRNNMFGLNLEYRELTQAMLRYFTGQENCEVHLIGHVLRDPAWVPDDDDASETLADEFPRIEDDYGINERLTKEFPGVVLAPNFADPIAAKSYIAGMDFFSGARMHACIAAFSTGVPVLPVAYSRKFAGLFGTLGYDTVADCRTETTDGIMAKLKTAFENRDALRQAVAAGHARGLQRLQAYEDILAEVLAAACRPA